MSPMIFGFFAGVNTWILLYAKLIWNAWINKWWAGGNLFLIADEFFGWIAWIYMLLDTFNSETYQYALRPLRFFSYMVSLMYVIGYTILAITAFEEFYVRDEMKETDA